MEESSAIETRESVMDEIISNAEAIAMSLLPKKSSEKYVKAYDKFMAWKKERKIEVDCFSEEVMLVYFDSMKG